MASTRNPQNTNYLQPTKFQVIFPRVSSATYFCQDISIPGISSSPVRQNTPFVDLYKPGDKLEYSSFSMEFIVDEELWAWEIIHDWMRGYSFPHDFDEYRNLNKLSEMSLPGLNTKPQYSQGELTILSALNNPKFKIKFIDMFPVSLSSVKFSTTASADKPMTAIAEFKYQLYNIQRI